VLAKPLWCVLLSLPLHGFPYAGKLRSAHVGDGSKDCGKVHKASFVDVHAHNTQYQCIRRFATRLGHPRPERSLLRRSERR
jgi:hypothetical protein